jgi:predicted Fe-Mo cluster-binding NifX family protein
MTDLMKLAITSTGNNLSADMDPRFGRAAYFIIVDSETLEYSVVENAQSLNLPQGAGIQAGKTIINQQASVLITGNCGPKAFQVLAQAGIDIKIGASGSIENVIQAYNRGELQSADTANVEGHWV